MKRISFSYIRVLISAGLIGLLLWLMRGKYSIILSEIRKTNLSLVAVGLFIYAINIWLCTWRLQILLASEGIHQPFYRLIELNFVGFFFNNFMPSAIGGDIVKAYYTGVITGEKAKSYASIFMDRLTGLFSFAGIGILALVISRETITQPVIKKSVLLFVLVCIMTALVSLNAVIARFVSKLLSKIHFKNIGANLLKIYNLLHSYRKKTGILAKAIFISVLSQVGYFILVYILFRAMNLDISFKLVFLIMPIVCVISMLPSLGGLGIRESSMVALFGPIVGIESAFGVGVLLFANLFLISLIGGIIYSSSPQFRLAKSGEKEFEREMEKETFYDR